MGSDQTTEFVVVGGGIGGPSCTLALAREGYSVRVLERTAEFREVGAGIQMALNASRVLAELGMLNSILDVGYLPRQIVFKHAVTGEQLTTIDLREKSVSRYGAPWVTFAP